MLLIVSLSIIALFIFGLIGCAFMERDRSVKAIPAFTRGSLSLLSSAIALLLPIASLGTLVFLGPAAGIGMGGLLPCALGIFAATCVSAVFLPAIANGDCRDWRDYLSLRFGDRIAQIAGAAFGCGEFLALALIGATTARQSAYLCGGSPETANLIAAPIAAVIFATAFLSRGDHRLVNVWLLGALSLGGFTLFLAALRGTGLNGAIDINRKLGTWVAFDTARGWGELGSPWMLASVAAVFVTLMFLARSDLRGEVAELPRRNRRGLTWLCGCGSLLIAAGGLAIGSGTAAHFHRDPFRVPPHWIANVDARTGRSLTDPATRTRRTSGKQAELLADSGDMLDPTSGRRLLRWEKAADRLNSENATEIVARGALLRPNSQQPFSDAAELFEESGERLDPAKIAVFHPPRSGRPRIMVEHELAAQEFMAEFARQTLGRGFSGFFATALLAAYCGYSFSRVRAATASIAARGVSARSAAFIAGGAMIFATLAASTMIADPLRSLFRIGACFGAPPIALVILGAISRRAESRSAACALAAGPICAIVFAVIYQREVHTAAMLPAAFAATMLCGWTAALVLGRTRSKREMSGLVLGCGPLGEIRPEEAEIEITIPVPPSPPPFSPPAPKSNWK